MMRKSGREIVLYYNPDTSIRVTKLKGVLVRMGIRIRNVAPEQVLDTVGALAGIPGYENTSKEAGEIAAQNTEGDTIKTEIAGETPGTETEYRAGNPVQSDANCTGLPLIEQEVLVMHGFSGRRIDELLAGLRKAGVSKVELKAVVTETNADWSFFHLYEEIKKEHERMNAKEEESMK